MTQQYVDPFGAPWRLNWIRMLLHWKGGIVQMLWIELLIALMVCAAALTAVYYAWRGESNTSDNVRNLTDAATFISRRFQAAIALMLGFYTIQMFNRWREIRNLEGNAMGTVNDLAFQISWRIRENDENDTDDSSNEEESPEKAEKSYPESDVSLVRLTLIRWLNLAHACVVGDVFEMNEHEFSSMDNLIKYGMATEKEGAILNRQQSEYKYVVPYLWVMDLIEELQRKELYGVDAGVVTTVSAGLVTSRRALADLYALKRLPIPLAYRQLTHLTVRFYLIMLLLAAVLQEKTEEGEDEGITKGAFWFLLVYLFEYLLFIGWLTCADAIGNPYRAWADQLDWQQYVENINRSSLLIACRFSELRTKDQSASESHIGRLEKIEMETIESWHGSMHNSQSTCQKRRGWKRVRKGLTGF